MSIPSFAGMQRGTVNLQMKSVSIQEIVEEIGNQTGIGFLYKGEGLKNHMVDEVNFKDKEWEEVLFEILDPIGKTFKVEKDLILIVDKPEVRVETEPKQEKKELKGTVTDEDGNTLPGVSVVVKGTLNGVATDMNGNYSISVGGDETVLVFSFVGMHSQEVAYSGQQVIDIKLQIDSEGLDEVVVTGMQRREKSKMVGSVSELSAEDLEYVGVVSIDEAMKGQLAGVYIRNNSGRPGEVGEIRIRGINTMTGNKQPLFVLDGMPMQDGEVTGDVSDLMMNGIGNIPPEDIETITILKDANSSAVYGARAANGVVVITTKQGKVGKDYVSYSAKFGVTLRPENDFEFMNSTQKVALERGIYNEFHPSYGGRVNNLLFDADNGVISKEEAGRQISELENTNTDWMKVLYRNAITQSHILSMSGGNKKTRYRASVNYQKSEGTLMENDFEMGGLNMKIDRYVKDNLRLSFNLYGTLKKNIEGQSQLDPFKYAVFANPYEKPYNADGSYAADMSYRNLYSNISNDTALDYYDFNMARELKENTKTNMYGTVRGQLGLEYSFLDGFRFSSRAVATYTSVHNMDESRAGTYRSYANNWLNSASEGTNNKILPEYNRGFLRESFNRTFSYTVRNSLEYNKKLKEHYIQLFAANEVAGRTMYGFNNMLPVYLQDSRLGGYPLWDNVGATQYERLRLSKLGGTNFAEDRSVSFIGSAVYSYDDRYALNYNVRYDGVDIIGIDNQFAPLWSAGFKWNAHNEEFMKSYDHIVSRLAFSAGYGFTGSINRDVLPFHTYEHTTDIYNNHPIGTNMQYGNPVLKWEKKEDLNLGMELSLFKGRVNLETRYFSEKVTNLLDQMRLPVSVGRESAYVNVGNLTNKGYEVSIRCEVIKDKDFLWEVRGNISKVANKLESVYNKDFPANANFYTENVQGHSTNSWFGYKFSHVNPDNGHAMVYMQEKTDQPAGTGVVTTYEDKLIDLTAVPLDQLGSKYVPYFLGHRDPDLYGGFNTRFRYKNFDLAANFVFAAGNKIPTFSDRKNGPDRYPTDVAASRTNRVVDVLNRWTQPGDITNIPKFSTSFTNYNRFLVDTDLEDGSYLKCTSISLGWRAPQEMLKKTFIKNLKASVVASNLFTLTKYSGTDPETQNAFGYPNTTNITFSLNIGF
jgi:TonB-linked SusC/RagA family outer membrane protein